MANKLKLAITFDPVLLKRVDAAARGLNMSRSAYMESACRSVLDESEGMAKAMGNEAVREAFFGAMTDPRVLQGLAEAMGAKLSPHQLKDAAGMIPALKKEIASETSGSAGVRRGRGKRK